ncbi:Ig-like domain-containing protein [Janthinobacterium sp. B9-8]|uniref:Ig-like domain-containing protein n=1 Tax=Janthinobacterium sp. B9-8 TaxID=1236179 RepID=UPI00061D11D7|nr:Ig-like domain-containing protein [Janthinobacterium sp. B9-8]AMC33181.1 hypothetical protein VN23_00345 [Janthinobacterium sp. B9-8]
MERINFNGKAARKVAGGLLLLATIMLTACNGSSGGDSSSTTPTPTPVPNASAVATKILVSTDKSTGVKTGGTDEATLTIQAIDKNGGAINGALIDLSTTTGVLSSSGVTTGADGKATVKFNAGDDKNNRVESITLSSGTAATNNLFTTAFPVKVIGSTVTITASANSLVSGTETQLEVLVKDGNEQLIDGAKVSFSNSGSGSVTFSAPEVTTVNGGKATVKVTGATAGLTTITATALGNTKTQDLTITGTSASSFRISSPAASRYALSTNTALPITVNAPGSSTVVFAATLGTWSNGKTTLEVPVVNGAASATFSSSSTGIATVSAYDKTKPSQSSSMSVALTADVANVSAVDVSVQSKASILAPSAGTQQNTTLITAKVTDKAGQPVGNIPVAFDISQSTGGGETVSPVVVLTSDGTDPNKPLGVAETTFTSGSLPSGQSSKSVGVRATALLANGATQPSIASAQITIAGGAGSISIGQASKIGSSTDNTRYQLSMSAIVADAAGNPPPVGTEVNISVWPLYFSTGSGCVYDKTFKAEDTNENLTLDAGEDGVISQVDNITFQLPLTSSSTPYVPKPSINSKNGKLDPPPAAAGTVPVKVKTEADGSAPFVFTYNKSDSIWTVVRMRASTKVQGTETVSESIFRLSPTKEDVDLPKTCFISDSKYNAIVP